MINRSVISLITQLVLFSLILLTPISQAQSGPSAILQSNTLIAGCQWDVKIALTGFAPNSIVTVSSNYTELVCASGELSTGSWSQVYGTSTDSNGDLTIGYIHQGTGSYNYSFEDKSGNQATLPFMTATPGPPSAAIISASPSTAVVGSSIELAIQVVDAYGFPVADGTSVIVTPSFGTISGNSTTVNGTVYRTLSSALAGISSISVSSSNGVLAVTGDTPTFVPGPPIIAYVTASPATAIVGQDINLLIRLYDAYLNLVTGVIPVNISTNLGNVSPSSTAAISGQATATLSSSQAGTVALTIDNLGLVVAGDTIEFILPPLYPRIDAPNIKNYPTPTLLSRQDFIETFEGGGACPENGEDCVLEPAAEEWYQTNFAVSGKGGHCYGFSVATTLFYRGIYDATDFDENAQTPFEIDTLSDELDRHLGIYHSFQFDRRISQFLTDRKNSTPNDILNMLEHEINENNNLDPYILAVFGEIDKNKSLPFGWVRAGHALVPYSIAYDANGHSLVSVYDSNYPGDVGRVIEFDPNANTWVYHMGQYTRSAGDVGGNDFWGGDFDDHTITLVPMSMHTGEHPSLPYKTSGGGAWLATDSEGLSNVLITDQHGNKLGVDNGVFYEEIPNGIPLIPLNDFSEASGYSYYLPDGSYQAKLTPSSDISGTAEFHYFGEGFGFSADSIYVTPLSEDTISFDTQSSQMEIMSNDQSKEINLVYAYSQPQAPSIGRKIEITGIEIGDNNRIALVLDESQDRINLDNSIGQAKDYNLSIRFSDLSAFTSTQFLYTNLSIASDAIQVLDFSETEQTQQVKLEVDQNSDGVTDEIVILKNQVNVFLPVIVK